MKPILITFLCALAAVLLMFLGLGIKNLFRRGTPFKRPCSSMDPYTGKRSGCQCANLPKADCPNTRKHSPLEVNEEMFE